MRLFLTEYQKRNTTLAIANAELLTQLRKVLRVSIGDHLWIQNPANEIKKTRYKISITNWNDTLLEGTIISQQHYDIHQNKTSMIIAMPNKREKIELIIQKLTECGINEIIFWPSERSVIKKRNPKKEARLQKIIKEAVEQSRGRIVPKLHFATDLTNYLSNTHVIIFDKTATGTIQPLTGSNIIGIIGPEGGFTPKDYKQFEAHKPEIISLGETVLRLETAAIIGARLLKNH